MKQISNASQGLSAAEKDFSLLAGKMRQGSDLLGAQADRGGPEVLLEMGERRGPRDRQHHRRAVQQPCQRYLPRGCMVALGNPGEWRIGPGEPALGERIERNERDSGAGADVDQSVGRAILE